MSDALKPRLPYLGTIDYDLIRPAIKEFERRVWFDGGLKNHVNGTTCRGQEGKADFLTVLVWTCAGRTMISFVDKDSGDWLSLMVAEDEDRPTMGLHERSISIGTMELWLKLVADNWQGVVDSKTVTLDILA